MKSLFSLILTLVVSVSAFCTPADIYNRIYTPHTVNTFDPALEQFQVGVHTVAGSGNCVWALLLYSDIWGGQTNITVYGNFSVTNNYGFRGNITYNIVNGSFPYWQPDRGGYDYYNPCILSVPGTQTYVSNTSFSFKGTD